MNSKEKVKRSFSFRFQASKINLKRKQTNTKFHTPSSPLKPFSSSSVINDDGEYNGIRKKSHKIEKRNFRKSISGRFKSFSSFRHKVKLKEPIDEETEPINTEKIVKNIGIDVDNIGLKAQLSKKFRRTLPRQFKSSSDFRKKQAAAYKTSMTKNKVICSDTVKQIAKSETTMKDLSSLQTGLSLKLKSRLNRDTESVDFSALIKHVPFTQTSKNKLACTVRPKTKTVSGELTLKEEVDEAEVDSQECKLCLGTQVLTDENLNVQVDYEPELKANEYKLGSPRSDVMSPTLADMYGQDKEMDVDFQMVTNAIVSSNLEVRELEGMNSSNAHNKLKLLQQELEAKDTKGGDSEIFGNYGEDNAITVEINKKNKAKGVSLDELKVNNFQMIDPKLKASFENPWVLQPVTNKPQVFLELEPRYESFGFEVNEFGDRQFGTLTSRSKKLNRNNSRESLDSFSSSIHSVHSQDLLFSDSEQEIEPDQMSISSSDSGNFDHHKIPFVSSEKSFDSGIATSSSKESKSLDSLRDMELDNNVSWVPDSKDKPVVKQSVSLDESNSSSNKTPKSWFGFKSGSFESDVSSKSSGKKEKLKQRRSLDSDLKIKEMTLDLTGSLSEMKKSKLTGSSDSGLSSVLSPVPEAKNKSTTKGSHSNLGDIDENRKFFTLPNPKRKNKSDASPKRRVSRIESISKRLTEKANSLTNIKLGTSFKLRNQSESDKTKTPFFKTRSLSNLMAKKGAEVASSITTLIRGRSNSNTLLNSPFKQQAKMKRKSQEEKENEFVYEKVRIHTPRKRPANSQELAAWKKRLQLNIKLANSCREFKASERHRTEGLLQGPQCSGSLSPIRSPTLLDEILKSVDNTKFRKRYDSRVRGVSLSDDETDEDSSHTSSNYLFGKQLSIGSSDGTSIRSDTSLGLICKACGRLRNNSSGSDSSKVSEKFLDDPSKSLSLSFTNVTNKNSQSLVDLFSVCKCSQNGKTHHHRLSWILPRSFKGIDKEALVKEFRNDMESNSNDSSPNSKASVKENKNMKSTSTKTERPHSMLELRYCDDIDNDKLNNNLKDLKSQRIGKPGKLSMKSKSLDHTKSPGTLLRHRPLMDLSADHLDDAIAQSEDSFNIETEIGNKIRHSCGDLLDESRRISIQVNDFEIDCDKLESEILNSCADIVDLDLEVESPIKDDQLDAQDNIFNYQKARSCGDLLDEGELFLGDKLKLQEQVRHKKEIRKLKVKSLSSSHDALSTLVPMEALDIGQEEEVLARHDEKQANETLKKSIDASNDIKLQAEVNKMQNELNDETKETQSKIESQVFETKELYKPIEDSIVTENCKCENKENDKEKMNVCDKCNELRDKSIQYQTKAISCDKFAQITTKPPLPKKRHRKVLSVSDISNQDNRQFSGLTKNDRYSMYDLPNKSPGDFLNKSIKKYSSISPNTEKDDKLENKTPKTDTSKSSARRFLFDEKQIKLYTKSNSLKTPKLDRLKSASSDEMCVMNSAKSSTDKNLWSAHSMNSISNNSWSDDVFNRLSFPLGPATPDTKLPLLGDFIESPPLARFSGLASPDYPEFPDPNVESVYKYDICLGYLVHSLQCDNQVICVYSLQRNKQLMESVITPLAALPGAPHTRPSEHSNVNKHKNQNKSKCEDLPNPASPITTVPSEQLSHAGRVLRTVLLSRFSHMVRDRKFHLRTYRRCMVGTEMVDWLQQQSPLVHSRNQAVGMWQALVEEGVIVHVCHEHQFKDKYLFYRFHEDDEGVSTVPTSSTKRESEDELQDILLMLAQIGPDAMMRMILRKLPHERTVEDLEIIYEELLHIKALSHLSTMVKRELASVLVFESHAKAGTVLFNQGDEGKSWYIILKGSVNVVIYGKGVVCTLHEGDDFGKLALVNDAPRAATIVLRDDNCHFLRVDKDDFNRILRDVEANTVRLKEHGQDVLVLEKIPSDIQSSDGTVQAHYKYSVMAGTPEKMLEHLLESRLESKSETEIDGFLEDFLLTHVIFMPCNHLCPVLLSHYHSSMADTSEQDAFEFMLNHKRCVLHFVQEWANIVGAAFQEDQTINAFLEELHICVLDDLQCYPTLKEDMVTLETILQSQSGSTEGKPKKRPSVGNFTLSRKHSRDNFGISQNKRKPIKPSDETIFKVYCADHTYSTLKLPRDTKVEHLLQNTIEKLGLGDDLILCEVKSTGERLIFKDNDLCVTSGLSINGRLFVTPKEHLDALTPLPEQEGPCDGSFSHIEMTSSREMAYYMTMYDWDLFACVQEYELIYQVFGRYKFGKITANLDLFLRRFNEIQFWVVTEMVLTINLSKRVSLLRKFIKLASYCKEHQNLNSFFAIVMGLSNIAVSRLSQTWEKLPGKFKKMFADFETLMDPSRNHRVYRLSVAKMVPPIIPFMPLLMKDMTFTHEGNKTYFDGLVNFEKMHMISQTLKTVRFCRSANLDIEIPGSQKASDTSEYIRNLQVIDNQRCLTQLSHKLEPRKT